MFSALLVVLLGLDFKSKPVASCNAVISKVKELCGFYNYTTLDPLDQRHAAQIKKHFGSLSVQNALVFQRFWFV